MLEKIRPASIADAERILQIYAPYVTETPISFEITIPPLAEIADRIRAYSKISPWLVFEHDAKIVGYAYASPHKSRAAYNFTVETSAYVAPEFQRRGIARKLYVELFQDLARRNYHLALAGVVLPNEASVRLHERMGFVFVGTYHEVGFKFGQWHDVGWWQRKI